jgi:hypothetical protein
MDSDRDPLEYEHLVLSLDLPHHVGVEAVPIEGNLTRSQRAEEGAQQSGTRRCDQIVEG